MNQEVPIISIGYARATFGDKYVDKVVTCPYSRLLFDWLLLSAHWTSPSSPCGPPHLRRTGHRRPSRGVALASRLLEHLASVLRVHLLQYVVGQTEAGGCDRGEPHRQRRHWSLGLLHD